MKKPIEEYIIGERIYVWDEYKTHTNPQDSGGAKYQGGRAYGIIIEIKDKIAKIKYDDLIELIEESLHDLRVDDPTPNPVSKSFKFVSPGISFKGDPTIVRPTIPDVAKDIVTAIVIYSNEMKNEIRSINKINDYIYQINDREVNIMTHQISYTDTIYG